MSDIPWLKTTAPSGDEGKDCTKEEEATLCDDSISHTQCSEAESLLHHAGPTPAAATATCPPPTGNPTSSSASRSDSLAALQLFYRFMDWVYNDFVNPLLAANFYATEVEGRGAEVLFYRKAVWARIVQRGKQQLCSNFVPVSCLHFLFRMEMVVYCLILIPHFTTAGVH